MQIFLRNLVFHNTHILGTIVKYDIVRFLQDYSAIIMQALIRCNMITVWYDIIDVLQGA